MIPLANKPNTDAPDSDYPYGNIRNKAGSVVTEGATHGTPVNKEVYADIHQFFERLMAIAGITPNELPDNAYSGFQLFEAFTQLANGYKCTSASSVAIGTGSKTFTVQQGLSFVGGENIKIASDADPNSDYMIAVVESYSGTTLNVTVLAIYPDATGTHADWTISLGGITRASLGAAGFQLLGLTKLAFISDVDAGTSSSLSVTPHGIKNAVTIPGVYNTHDDRKVVKKVIDIGAWDISTDVTKVISTSINIEQVLSVDGVIYADDSSAYLIGDWRTGGTLAVSVAVTLISNGSITLGRNTFGGYLAANWNDAVMNRGILNVTYLEAITPDA